MADLVVEFFHRDLGPAEAADLAALFDSSPEEAERFAEMALAEYKATGLPEPTWESRRWYLRGGAWRWPLALLLLAGAAFAFWPESSPVRPDLGLEGEAFSIEKRRPRIRREMPVSEAGQPLSLPPIEGEPIRLKESWSGPDKIQRGSRLGVVVKQALPGMAVVTVKDSEGRELRRLFQGMLQKGEWRFEWDGRLEGGLAAKPGNYSIAVSRGESVQTKQLILKPSRP